jgi:DNA (cytosine-5-)-methyltransferase
MIELNKLYNEDCINFLKKINDNTITTCITDPPYNYEFIGKNWNDKEIKRRLLNAQSNKKILVKNIPYGSGLSGGVRNKRWYEKNKNNIFDYQKWFENIGKELFRILKPGSFCMVFNSTRTIAHIQIALENAGFYTKDIIVWKRQSGIPKGLNISKKLKKMNRTDYENWDGWHSCLRNEWEAILLVQKPLSNNHIETLDKYGTGLLYTKEFENFKSNIIENITRERKEEFNNHPTVKPLNLMQELVKLTTPKRKENIILDPFAGSGTTLLAAKIEGLNYLGCEIVSEYVDIFYKRLNIIIE